MTIIYGIDTAKPVSPHDVRDAIVTCFVAAHAEILDDMKNYSGDMPSEELERLKLLNVQQLVRSFFKEVKGDFEEPTKESIMLVLGKLKEFAAHFRKPEIIEKHYGEIMELVKALK